MFLLSGGWGLLVFLIPVHGVVASDSHKTMAAGQKIASPRLRVK